MKLWKYLLNFLSFYELHINAISQSLAQDPKDDPRGSLDSISGGSYFWSTPLNNKLCCVLSLHILPVKWRNWLEWPLMLQFYLLSQEKKCCHLYCLKFHFCIKSQELIYPNTIHWRQLTTGQCRTRHIQRPHAMLFDEASKETFIILLHPSPVLATLWTLSL